MHLLCPPILACLQAVWATGVWCEEALAAGAIASAVVASAATMRRRIGRTVRNIPRALLANRSGSVAREHDCEGGSGNGPDYTGPVEVVGDDHYGLDRDGNGQACEN